MKTSTSSKKQSASTGSAFQSKAKNQANSASILQAYKKGTPQLAVEDEETSQLKENKTGLPDHLKSGVENLSGHSLDDVKVHYNSAQPAALQAHAYAQGTDIHVAPGQEKHLPHEAWHVVQQKQGRVQPTKQLKGATNINDDAELEKEADVMGAKALSASNLPHKQVKMPNGKLTNVIQGYFETSGFTHAKEMWSKAETNALHLNDRLDLRTRAGDTYAPELKTNLELKGTKAGSTIAGEAYETLHWEQPRGKSNVIGPGGSSGADLMEYQATKNGGDITSFGEVKSASNKDSCKSGIANAYKDRGQTNIIMYALDEALLDEGESFVRSGVSYVVSYERYDYWDIGADRYNWVATVQLIDQDRELYLFMKP